jgi:hypothetical protein
MSFAYQQIPVDDSQAVRLERGSSSGSSKRPSSAVLAVAVLGIVLLSTLVGVSFRGNRAASPSIDSSSVATEEANVRPIFRSSKEVCRDPNYSHTTLKIAHEMPVVALLGRAEGAAFEASCVKRVGDFFYVVSDDSPDLGKIAVDLQYSDPDNTLIRRVSSGKDEIETTEGGYEAFFHDPTTGAFYGVVEAVSLGEPDKFHSVIDQLNIDPVKNTYVKTASCASDYEFSSSNKGFEGALYVQRKEGAYLIGLCEGNFCEGGVKGRTPGNGRLVVLKLEQNVEIHGKKYSCVWKTVKVVTLPKAVNFVDYSAIALNGNRVAISSQENAQVYIGSMDLESFEVSSDGITYNFPRNDNCEIVYCSVEGLEWLGDNMLVAASDQMKDGGRQPFRCLAHDQAVHVFVIPNEPEAV